MHAWIESLLDCTAAIFLNGEVEELGDAKDVHDRRIWCMFIAKSPELQITIWKQWVFANERNTITQNETTD